MKIAIVTPYFKEPAAKLERCRNSILNQVEVGGHEIHQFVMADGHPQSEIDAWDATHIPLPASRDSGDTPRLIGVMLAISAGYDAFAFLDADNWYEPGFIDEMTTALESTKSDIATCPRWLWRPDETRMGVDEESDGVTFNDGNCYLFRTDISFVLNAVAFKKDRHHCLIADQMLWKEIKTCGLKVQHVTTPLVNYETNNAWHYDWFNETPPPDSKRLIIDQGDGRHYVCLEEDVEKRPDGTMFCPPERLMAPDGSKPYARKTS